MKTKQLNLLELHVKIRNQPSVFGERQVASNTSYDINHCLLQQMTAVKIVEPPALDPSSSAINHREKKEKYTLASLPFPRGAASAYTRNWRKAFKSTLIHWAATFRDPFGTNAVLENIIPEIWKAVFPTIANEVVGSSRQVIIHLVSAHFSGKFIKSFITWSTIGR